MDGLPGPPGRREMARALLRAFDHPPTLSTPGQMPTPAIGPLVDPLTDRELEVLTLVAAGRSNREIADELFVTVDTVKKHNTHILAKLDCANRTEAAARARELGLLP